MKIFIKKGDKNEIEFNKYGSEKKVRLTLTESQINDISKGETIVFDVKHLTKEEMFELVSLGIFHSGK